MSAATAPGRSREGQITSSSRRGNSLPTAGWAREACVEILLARYTLNPAIRRLGPVDLGRGTWCAATLEDPAAKLNINLAEREALVTTLSAFGRRLSADSLADALLDWRDP